MSGGLGKLYEDLSFPVNAGNLPMRRDQLRARMRLMPVMVGGQLVLEPLYVMLLWEHAAHGGLLLWWGAMLILHLVEAVWWLRHRTRLDTMEDCRKWHERFWKVALAAGLMWGLTAIWFFPADMPYQALQLCVLFGISAAAVTTNQNHLPSLYADILGIMLPLVVRVALEQDGIHWILAGMLLIFLVVVLNTGRELGRVFWRSLVQRYENDALLAQLTEQKAVAEQARQKAELANSDKSRFLAAASHDLRQPLQALTLFSEALSARVGDPHTAKLAEQIGKSVHALSDMFNELLDLSRLESGMLEPRWQHFSIVPLLDRVYVSFAPLAHGKGLAFELPHAETMSGSDALVYSDPFLLERVLRNLLTNAIRYTDAGQVALRCQRVGDTLRIEVADTGIGIRPEVIPHIFEEYYQADNPHRDRRKGLGLGLAIVRRIERLLGLQVEVSSIPGRGTQFAFSLPAGDAAWLTEPFAITHSRHDLSGAVVALVEDDPDIRQTAAGLMEQWGCRVFPAEEPGEVMRAMDLRQVRPDLIVCDYRLPHGLTAPRVIAQMREHWGADLPAMVVTGDTGPEVLQEVRACGALLLHKPASPARLRSMMYLAIHGE